MELGVLTYSIHVFRSCCVSRALQLENLSNYVRVWTDKGSVFSCFRSHLGPIDCGGPELLEEMSHLCPVFFMSNSVRIFSLVL